MAARRFPARIFPAMAADAMSWLTVPKAILATSARSQGQTAQAAKTRDGRSLRGSTREINNFRQPIDFIAHLLDFGWVGV
jgi:hypothetical protein